MSVSNLDKFYDIIGELDYNELKRALEYLNIEDEFGTIDDFMLNEVDKKQIHDSVWLPTAYINDKFVLFLDTDLKSCERWLYYIGAENDSELRFFNGDYCIFEIHSNRLERFNSE